MRRVIIFIVWLLFLAAAGICYSSEGTSQNIDFVLSHLADSSKDSSTEPDSQTDGASDLEYLATTIIWLYQKTISSQDLPACNFRPSCSRFTMDAIRQGGVLKGTLLGGDRLMRCHWFTKRSYADEYGHAHGQDTDYLHDPVDRYLKSER